MKKETEFRELFDNVLSYVDNNTIRSQGKEFIYLSNQIQVCLKSVEGIEVGNLCRQFLHELSELDFHINRAAEELEDKFSILTFGSADAGKTAVVKTLLGIEDQHQLSSKKINCLNLFHQDSSKEKKLEIISLDRTRKLLDPDEAMKYFEQGYPANGNTKKEIMEILFAIPDADLLTEFRFLDNYSDRLDLSDPVIDRADGIFWIFDLSDPDKMNSETFLSEVKNTAGKLRKEVKIVAVLNKLDILERNEGKTIATDLVKSIKKSLAGSFDDIFEISSLVGSNKKYRNRLSVLKKGLGSVFLTENSNKKRSVLDKLESFRNRITKANNTFLENLLEFTLKRNQLADLIETDISKITDNIKLDFEFLLDRYERRVSNNINSKIYDLIEIEDDYSIKEFFLYNIFTSKRLQGDLAEISKTYNEQILNLLSKLEEKINIAQYTDLSGNRSINQQSSDQPDTGIKEKITVGTVFHEEEDAVREILSIIIFPTIDSNSDNLYGVLKNKIEVNKLTEKQLKRYMEKMNDQLADFIKKLQVEIDFKIQENNYPIISYFNRSQDSIFVKLLCDAKKLDLIRDEVNKLNERISVRQEKSSYQQLREIFS
jgi:hypothetical protein